MGAQTYLNVDATMSSINSGDKMGVALNSVSVFLDATAFGTMGKMFGKASFSLGGIGLKNPNGIRVNVYSSGTKLRYLNSGKAVGSNWQKTLNEAFGLRNSSIEAAISQYGARMNFLCPNTARIYSCGSFFGMIRSCHYTRRKF
jgi:hypothetical protein